MITTILAATFFEQYGMLIFLGVLIVGMLVFNVVSGKKKAKQRQELLNSMGVGTKILTIGGMYGTIVGVTSDNKLIVNVGTDESETLIVFDKQSIRTTVSGYAANAAATAEAEKKQ
ncbi:MAG: preprotein translocase subunit YajC [Clostridiales bacterium]|jgi:preprotein translocase subunit YajC|nr:preprotein translocase subunit YajC [Clostridiales bacterium]